MEALRKLEEVQRTLQLLQSRGIVGSSSAEIHGDSDRFLAQFLLFLVQPCGELDMSKKYELISAYLPKFSSEILEEASVWLCEEGCQHILADKLSPPICHDEIDVVPLQNDFNSMPMVGLDAMLRANSTLEDFCRSYFMFHDIDVKMPQSIFQHLPVLSFTESYIYQLDNFNERFQQIPIGEMETSGRIAEEANRSWINTFRTDPFGPLIILLEHHGLLTQRIREELTCGEEYWALERKLCRALIDKKEISIEDVMKAICLKSFDYRVLNLLLYQLRGDKVNELHMEFLSVSEFLVEISDDLFDYEDDVLENNYNILRMFVRIYGSSKAPVMLAKCIAEAEERYDQLLKTLDSELSLKYRQRCEEATKEGGKLSGHALGTWSMPPVIADEELYQSKLLNP